MVTDTKHPPADLAQPPEHAGPAEPPLGKPTLPPLAQADRDFLLFYFQCNQDPIRAANDSNSNYVELLAWTSRPDIAAYLAHASRLQLQHQRNLALASLEEVLRTARDPVERRRAATTLLRATVPQPVRSARLARAAKPPEPPQDPRDPVAASRATAGASESIRPADPRAAQAPSDDSHGYPEHPQDPLEQAEVNSQHEQHRQPTDIENALIPIKQPADPAPEPCASP